MNHRTEVDDDDVSYKLFDDGTMLIKVDGVVQRRRFHYEPDLGHRQYVVPDTLAGEQLCRTADGSMEITTVAKPTPLATTTAPLFPED